MPETPDYDKSSIPVAHAPSHEAGGTDEINVGGLAGVLTEEQLSSWAGVSGKPATFPPVAHAVNHEFGGGDEVDVGGLSGVLADEQLSSWAGVSGKPLTFDPIGHHARHEAGGSDEVILNLGMFDINISGDLEPVTLIGALDQYFELNGLDDIMPKAA